MMMLSSCVQSVKTYVAKALADLNHFSFLYLDDKDKFVEVRPVRFPRLRFSVHEFVPGLVYVFIVTDVYCVSFLLISFTVHLA